MKLERSSWNLDISKSVGSCVDDTLLSGTQEKGETQLRQACEPEKALMRLRM
jgi:hypothetical protein